MPTITLDPPLPSRSRQRQPTLLVLHATAGATARSSVDVLRARGLGYHYIIARDGKDSAKSANADGTEAVVFACVPISRVAFHVGSQIPVPGVEGDINANSVGISLANIQNRKQPEPYTPRQIDAMHQIIKDVLAALPSIKLITAHAFVQPWNRSDPQNLNIDGIAAQHGLTVWRPTKAEIAAHTPPKAKVG